MLSISHFNSRQTTIAERLLNISRICGGTYFKYTYIQYSTVDQLISKTIILYVSVITVPKNVTRHFNLRITLFQYMYQLLLKRLFITEAIREKCKRTKRYCMQKIPLIGENKREGECSLMQQLTHPAHPKDSYRLRTCASAAKREKYENGQ